LLNTERAIPVLIASETEAPIKPPAAAVPLNALSNTSLNIAGICGALRNMMKRPARM